MISKTDNEIRVELKYCERCGGLWFRRENSRQIFCVPCTQLPSFARGPERADYSQPGAQPRVASVRPRESRSDDCAPRVHLPTANNNVRISGGAA
jgi:Zn-finger nucleic acid-binding protein